MQVSAILKCLADSNRLIIALLIKHEQELCVCELVQALQLPQPKVSQFLAALKSAQILISKRQGQWIYYRIDPKLPLWVLGLLDDLASSYPKLITSPKQRLEQMGNRPLRKRVCCP